MPTKTLPFSFEEWLDRHSPPWVDKATLERPLLAPSSEVFFLPALIQVGRHRFGDEWQEAEQNARRMVKPVLKPFTPMAMPKPPAKPEILTRIPMSLSGYPNNFEGESAEHFEQRKAAAAKSYPDWEEKCAKLAEFNRDAEISHLPRHQAAVAAFEANKLAVEKLATARDLLLQHIIDGLPATLRRDGLTKDLRSDWFAGVRDQISLLERGAVQYEAKFWSVFVDRAALDKVLRRVPVVVVPEIDTAALSKYLQLALYVHQQGFGPTYDGQKKEVRRALVAVAPMFGLSLSGEQEEYLATFLRNEDAQLGKNRRSKLTSRP